MDNYAFPGAGTDAAFIAADLFSRLFEDLFRSLEDDLSCARVSSAGERRKLANSTI